MVEKTRYISKEPIDKGWSSDKKYCITTDNGEKFLMRVTPKENSANHVNMFRILQQVATLGVSMCKPIELGKYDENVYTIYTWIDGKDAEEIIPFLEESEQYNYGLDVGKSLRSFILSQLQIISLIGRLDSMQK